MDEEKDVYNLPIAAFTFGKNGQALPYYPIQDLKDISKDNINKNNELRKNNISIESKGSKESNNYSNDDSEKRFSFKNIFKKNTKSSNNNNKNFNMNLNNNFDNNNFVFIDKEDSNSSYLKIILYLISYMKLLNNYFVNELQLSNEQNNSNKEKLLIIIKDILIKIEQIRNIDKNINNSININNIINIEQLKEHLSNLFKSKNKFLKNSPDDPIDFLYIIINLLHSLKAKKEQKEASNIICSDCFSHKYLWIKMLKIYECECKSQSKKILNKNNFFIDIPISIIINKFIKNNLFDMYQKLFIYYRQIISNTIINIDCPKFGNECKINKVHYKYILKNFPAYLIFNLDIECFKNNELIYSLKEILKTFVLIPHNLNINSLFEVEKNNNNNFYELIGIIFLKISKVYTCMFKQNNIFNYYDDNIFLNFNNYYDIIIYSFKNGLIPIAILYQNINKNADKNCVDRNNINNDMNYELTKDHILKLEKYIKNTNCLNKNFKNKIRTSENIISDDFIINYNLNSNNNNNPSFSDNHNSSRYSGSINSFSSYQKNEYICNHCERINKIENKMCFFCGYNNQPFLNNINNNVNKNIRKQKSQNINKNNIKKKVSVTQGMENKSQNNELGEIDDEYKNIDPHVLKYFDMPRPYIPPPSKNDEKVKSGKQSPKLNKNKIPHRTNNNNKNNSNNIPLKKSIKNNKINIINNNNNEIIKLNEGGQPKYLFNNSESNTIENNLLNKLNPNNNLKRNINIIHKKRNSNSDNLLNNNYYSELNNNHLNINLKINNNNNYNIFDFSNKKNLINIEDYSAYGTDENNFTDKKLLKKINLIKNKKGNKININNNNSSNNLHNNYLNFKFVNNNNLSNSNNNINRLNFGIYLQNNKGNWICEYCLNENNNNENYCLNCKRNRNIKQNNKGKNYFSTNKDRINNLLNENKSQNK